MTLELSTPSPADLPELVEALACFQREGAPVQLHPGDLGWHQRFGAARMAQELRVWRRDGAPVAVGFVESGVIRLGLDPEADRDEEVARRLADDLSDPAAGVLPEGEASVEVRLGEALRRTLRERGWVDDEPWTPLHVDLTQAPPTVDLRVEVVGPDRVADRVAIQRSAFANSTFTPERWHEMARGPAYRRARCLVGYDEHGNAVAAATAWSAGQDRPGLIEPLGAHADHRGHGHGRAITIASAAALRELGASSATVVTPAANVGGVGAYRAAGFTASPDVTDLRRPTT